MGLFDFIHSLSNNIENENQSEHTSRKLSIHKWNHSVGIVHRKASSTVYNTPMYLNNSSTAVYNICL